MLRLGQMPVSIKGRPFARRHWELRKLGAEIGPLLFARVIAHLQNDVLLAAAAKHIEVAIAERQSEPLSESRA